MSILTEFKTVDLIIESETETLGVDAFALALIKAERQVRRLLTHLIFQFPCFEERDIPTLREALGASRRVYFDGFEKGINALSPTLTSEMIGAEYPLLNIQLKEAIDHRNKIFHGQLTSRGLSRDDLLSYVENIRSWCQSLAKGGLSEFGYDGFARDSFRKSDRANIASRLRMQIGSIDDYRNFIRETMERR